MSSNNRIIHSEKVLFSNSCPFMKLFFRWKWFLHAFLILIRNVMKDEVKKDFVYECKTSEEVSNFEKQSPINLFQTFFFSWYILLHLCIWCNLDREKKHRSTITPPKTIARRKVTQKKHFYADEVSRLLCFYDYIWMTDDYVTNFLSGRCWKTTRRWNEVSFSHMVELVFTSQKSQSSCLSPLKKRRESKKKEI